MKNIDMIFFDYGNTLIYEKVLEGPKSLEKIYQLIENKSDTSLEDFFELFYQKREAYKKAYHSKGLDFHYKDLFGEVFNMLNFSTSHSLEIISKIYFDQYAAGYPMEGAGELLDYLEKKKIAYGVISNLSWSGDILRTRFKEVLGKDIRLVITSADWKYRKPRAELFKIAAKQANTKPNKLLYVGDNPLCDIKGSIDSGMKAIYYKAKTETPFVLENEKIQLEDGHIKVENLRDIITLIEEERID